MNKSILIVGLLICFSGCQLEKEIKFKVDPPFASLEDPAASVTVNPTIEQVVRFDNDIGIEVPANAFVDSEGNVISKEVTLLLSKYNTASEIIVSGIPMTYQDGNEILNFESAGMFRILGESEGAPVYIDKNKELVINYPSRTYGDFDFFYFEEEVKSDSTIVGNWRKISSDQTKEEHAFESHGDFRLNFATENYPELAPLAGTEWKLATDYSDPRQSQNSWVLEEEWSSIEISKPKYGFAESLLLTEVNYERYLGLGAIMVTQDGNRIITSHKPDTKIWDRFGKLLSTIEDVSTDFDPVENYDDRYLVVDKEDGDYIYTLDGAEAGVLPKSHNRSLANFQDIIVYREYGTEATTYIYDISTKSTKRIHIEQEETNLNFLEPKVYGNYILTQQDQLITNSVNGIVIYDLEGNVLKQRDGSFHTIKDAGEHSILIETLFGGLIWWDYQSNTERVSDRSSFNLSIRLVGNTYYHSYQQKIKGTDFVLINEATANNSVAWNYKLNETLRLPFDAKFNWDPVLPPNLIEGFSRIDTTYHMFDILANKDVFTIPGLNPCFRCDFGGTKTLVSQNKDFVLINNESHSWLYSLEGEYIKDFKEYDSLILTTGFIDNAVYTVSENGVYKVWNFDGTERLSKLLKNDSYIYSRINQGKINTADRVFRGQKFYNKLGHLELAPGNSKLYQFIDSTLIIQLQDSKLAELKSLFRTNKESHQLLLRAGEKEFSTHVYLSKSDLKRIERYYSLRANSVLGERDRQANELKTIRRFAINNFGIYNWDRIIEDSNRIYLAANFEFDVPVDNSNISIFHITDYNGPAVVKYDRNNWDKFSFDLSLPNKLIAILPDGRVALFVDEDFENIRSNVVSNGQTYKFKMKTVNDPISSVEALDQIIKGL